MDTGQYIPTADMAAKYCQRMRRKRIRGHGPEKPGLEDLALVVQVYAPRRSRIVQ
jgi:hypothetical protein